MIRFFLGFFLIIALEVPQDDKMEGMILFCILLWLMIDGIGDVVNEMEGEE